MDLWLMFAMIVPLVVYVVIDAKYGIKAGIVSALVCTVFVVALFYLKLGTLDEMIYVEVVLLFALSGLSLYLNNDHYFKVQPAIIATIVGSYVLYLQFFGEPIFIKYVPMMKAMAPEYAEVMGSPQALVRLRQGSLFTGIAFLLHAVIVGYAALKLSNIKWLIARICIYPLLLLAVFLAQFGVA